MAARMPVKVEYQAPGESTWRSVEQESPEVARRRQLLALRRRARSLLDEADARRPPPSSRSEEPPPPSEVAAFERDMAAAMGEWERFVAAGAKKLFRDVDEVVHRAVQEVVGEVKGRRSDK